MTCVQFSLASSYFYPLPLSSQRKISHSAWQISRTISMQPAASILEVTQQVQQRRSDSLTRPAWCIAGRAPIVSRFSPGTSFRRHYLCGFFPGLLSSAGSPLVLEIAQMTSSQVRFSSSFTTNFMAHPHVLSQMISRHERGVPCFSCPLSCPHLLQYPIGSQKGAENDV